MRAGIYLPVSYPRGVPPVAEVVGYAAEAEELGFDDLWVGDHLLWRTPMPDPLTMLAALATRTSRIGLGINVFQLGLRPAIVSARMLGTLWWLTGGRLHLGVGVGGDLLPELAAVGLSKEGRGKRLDRSLSELREWWALEGEHEVAPRPDGHLPLWIGGRSDATLLRAIRERADAFSAHMVTPDQLSKVRDRLETLAREAGVPAPRTAVTVMVDMERPGAEGEGDAFLAAHYGDAGEKVSRYVVRGDSVRCAEGVAAFAAVADHVILLPVAFDPRPRLGALHELVEAVR
jgi:alkanesulfonate monooxygenase SsuD/methylene tetrahydromethanopterin reductase-like flavin-dependent oxidoreductase (luciferase family)